MKPWQIVVTVIAVAALGLGAFGTYQSIGLGSRAGDIEDDVSSVEGRADVLEDNVSAIDADIVSIEGNIATVETDVGTLEVDLSDVNAEITSIQGNIATIETDIGTLQVDVSGINAEITSIEGNVATIETDIGTLQVDLSDINAEITSIQGDVATIETDIGTIQADLSDINAEITSIQDNIATIQTDIGTLQVDVSSLESQVAVPSPEFYGPIVLNIGTGYGSQPIYLPHPMYRVEFVFDVSGSAVYYEVWDPYWNVILSYSMDCITYYTDEGGGAFVAATWGWYYIYFNSSGTVTPSIITLYYAIYPAAPVVHGE